MRVMRAQVTTPPSRDATAVLLLSPKGCSGYRAWSRCPCSRCPRAACFSMQHLQASAKHFSSDSMMPVDASCACAAAVAAVSRALAAAAFFATTVCCHGCCCRCTITWRARVRFCCLHPWAESPCTRTMLARSGAFMRPSLASVNHGVSHGRSRGCGLVPKFPMKGSMVLTRLFRVFFLFCPGGMYVSPWPLLGGTSSSTKIWWRKWKSRSSLMAGRWPQSGHSRSWQAADGFLHIRLRMNSPHVLVRRSSCWMHGAGGVRTGAGSAGPLMAWMRIIMSSSVLGSGKSLASAATDALGPLRQTASCSSSVLASESESIPDCSDAESLSCSSAELSVIS